MVLYHEQNGIARIILHTPDTLNAMNRVLLQSLALILEKVSSDDAVKAAIITEAGNE